MSWSVAARGRLPVVKDYIAKKFAEIKGYSKQELDLKDAAAALVAQALTSLENEQPYCNFVEVKANGSESSNRSETPTKVSQTIEVTVKPIYDLME